MNRKMSETDNDAEKTAKRRGSRRKLDRVRIREISLIHKETLAQEDGYSLLPKGDSLWDEIAEEIQSEWPGSSLYAYISKNTDGIRELICKNYPITKRHNNVTNVRTDCTDSTLNSLNESSNCHMIKMTVSDFERLIHTRVLRRGTGCKKPLKVREIDKDLLEHLLNDELQKKSRIQCQYKFKKIEMNNHMSQGYIRGNCNMCGARCESFIRKENEVVSISCFPQRPKSGRCGQRPCGQNETKEFQSHNQGLDPPSIEKRQDCEAEELQVDKNPIRALHLLRACKLKGEISLIQDFPFCVCYSTKHQRTVYAKLTGRNPCSVAICQIDVAVAPIKLTGDSACNEVKLFQVITPTDGGQIAVNQMLSSSESPHIISHWLSDWIEEFVLNSPAEVIVDGSIPVLTACVYAFNGFLSINNYVHRFFDHSSVLPEIIIKIDHMLILRKYVALLQDDDPIIRNFLVTAIAKLMTCSTKDEAHPIVKGLMILTYSDCRRQANDPKLSAWDVAKQVLDEIITPDVYDILEIEQHILFDITKPCHFPPELGSDYERDSNQWSTWAQNILDDAITNINKNPGTIASAWWMPKFLNELMHDLEWFPLWASMDMIRQYQFLHGHASIHSSEVELNEFREAALKRFSSPLRPDVFIEIHKDYLDGNLQTGINSNSHGTFTLHSDSQNGVNDDTSDPSTEREDQSSIDFDGITCTSSPRKECRVCKETLETSAVVCCPICKTEVHSECSLVIGNVGKSSNFQTLCKLCDRLKSSHRIIEGNQFENWKNKTMKHRKLEEQKKNKSTNIPIIRSAINMKILNNVQDDNKNVKIINTCPLDAITQLMIALANQSESFLNDVIYRYKSQNKFMKMLCDINDKGINDLISRQRYAILKEIINKERLKSSGRRNLIFDCNSVVIETYQQIVNIPIALKEMTSDGCEGCALFQDELTIISVPLDVLLKGMFNWNDLEDFIGHDALSACNEGGIHRSFVNITQLYMALEIISPMDEHGNYEHVELRQIPPVIQICNMTEKMYLRGIIHFDRPSGATDLKKLIAATDEVTGAVGHYHTYLVENGKWTHFDNSSQCCEETTNVVPHLILYSR